MTRLLLASIATLLAALSGVILPAWGATFADDAGRAVEVPPRIERVFAAGPPAAILLYTLAPERLLGWPRENRQREKEYLKEPFASLPATGRLTGRGNTTSPEALVALKPDLILDVGSTRGSFVDLAERVQSQTGIPYVLLAGHFENAAHNYRRLGKLLGLEGRAEELAAWAERMVRDLETRLATLPPERRPRVYYGRGPEGLETGLAGSINTEVLERVGAVNVAEAAGPGGLTQVGLEQVLAWNPEVIVTTDPNFFAKVRVDPRWSGVAAVKSGRVHLAPKLPFGWIDFPPGVNRLIGARWLAAVLHPTLFPEDIRPIVRDFYRRFYHVELDAAQVERLLTVAEADEVGR